jgi:hypothetical protein
MNSLEESRKNFIWWHGFVEDVNDPLKLGRCRVRIAGIHSPDKKEIPTDHLPWATPIMPYNSASSSGVGISPTGILPGTWVVGFFQDGENSQQPMVMGSYNGINRLTGITSKNPSFGFNDPLGKFPRNPYVDEPDVNKLARNQDTGNTIVSKKLRDRDTCNPTALGGGWSEPATPYNAQYPKNHVYESESGHIFEVDDTPKAERLHKFHKSGTFEEIHPDGSKVEKIVGDDYLIIRKNNHISVYGNSSVNVGGTIKISSGKGIDVQISGNSRIHVTGNTTMQTDGNFLHHVGGTYRVLSRGRMTLVAPRIDLNPSGVSPRSNFPGFSLNRSCPPVSRLPIRTTPKIKFEFDDGNQIEVDEEREFRTRNRGWVKAKDLNENDDILNLEQRKR